MSCLWENCNILYFSLFEIFRAGNNNVSKCVCILRPASNKRVLVSTSKHPFMASELSYSQNCKADNLRMVTVLSVSTGSTIQTGHHHHDHRLAPLDGASASCGALFQINTGRVYAKVIPMQSSFWRRYALFQIPVIIISRIHIISMVCCRAVKRAIKFPTSWEIL